MDHLSDWEPSYTRTADALGIERARELIRDDGRLRAGLDTGLLPYGRGERHVRAAKP